VAFLRIHQATSSVDDFSRFVHQPRRDHPILSQVTILRVPLSKSGLVQRSIRMLISP
jgi:hypothetical protein